MRKAHTLASRVFERLLKSGFNMKIPYYELFVVSLCVLQIHMHKQLPRVCVCVCAIEIQLLVSLFAAPQKAKKKGERKNQAKLFRPQKKTRHILRASSGKRVYLCVSLISGGCHLDIATTTAA